MKNKTWQIIVITIVSTLLVACGNESSNVDVESKNNISTEESKPATIIEESDIYVDTDYSGESVDTSEYETVEEEEMPPINPCFDSLLEQDMKIMGVDCLYMSEEELVQNYGMPARKEGTDICWEYEEDGIKYSVTMMIGDTYNFYTEGYKMMKKQDSRFPTEFCRIKENVTPSDYSTVSSWFDDGIFNHAYEYSTLNTYDDFRNKIGDNGRLSCVGLPNIGVMWYFEEIDKLMRIDFDAKTGIISDYSREKPSMQTIYEYSKYIEGYYDTW